MTLGCRPPFELEETPRRPHGRRRLAERAWRPAGERRTRAWLRAFNEV